MLTIEALKDNRYRVILQGDLDSPRAEFIVFGREGLHQAIDHHFYLHIMDDNSEIPHLKGKGLTGVLEVMDFLVEVNIPNCPICKALSEKAKSAS